MAKAIRQIRWEEPNQADKQAQDLNEILKALAENKEAVLSCIEFVKGMHDLKVFETGGALLKKSDEVGAIAMQQINQPAVHNMIKSGFGIFKFLGTIKPSQLETVLKGVRQGIEKMSQTVENGEKESLWKMRKRLSKPEIRTVMTSMFDFLEGMGSAFLRSKVNNK
ncbi:DUF1641 domain-containing protein [Niallia endozanthoxylica]|uniref:DUF1641 domain-containing protein n=1 Tax=Niallia endozanthoxylica TaxID=2036016 RepID=A0A5J5GZF7_9BACI|nr:DUF1641 domain-containing protein [Niallia endozanthoxylica]KAA9013357.1 DUF1641 domain-containing protein [Niallia endozanthoxylica]